MKLIESFGYRNFSIPDLPDIPDFDSSSFYSPYVPIGSSLSGTNTGDRDTMSNFSTFINNQRSYLRTQKEVAEARRKLVDNEANAAYFSVNEKIKKARQEAKRKGKPFYAAQFFNAAYFSVNEKIKKARQEAKRKGKPFYAAQFFKETFLDAKDDTMNKKGKAKAKAKQEVAAARAAEYEPLPTFDFSTPNEKAPTAVSAFPSYLPDKAAARTPAWKPQTTDSGLPKPEKLEINATTKQSYAYTTRSEAKGRPVETAGEIAENEYFDIATAMAHRKNDAPLHVTIKDSPLEFDRMSDQPTPSNKPRL